MTDHDDPLLEPDPRFPDRPHTLDFARLSGAVGHQDAVGDMLGLEAALQVDFDSLAYMARGRIQMAMLSGARSGLSGELILQTIYMDAFNLGVLFQQRGGRRLDETGTTPEKGGSL